MKRPGRRWPPIEVPSAMPRPSKFTPELGRRAVALAVVGLPHRAIARELGLGPRPLADWLARGRKADRSTAPGIWAPSFDIAAADSRHRRTRARIARETAAAKARWQ